MKLNKNLVVFLGIAAHLLAAVFSIGAHQCDEIFQIFEFAGYKLGMNTAAELPWEFAEQMRSGIQPLIVYGFTRLLAPLSITNPFTIAAIIRCLQALFSLWVMLQFLKLMERELRSPRQVAWLYGFSLLFWCLPYFHARFNSENFSATLFLLGFVWIFRSLRDGISPAPFLMAGLLFGIAFEARFQTCFMIIGFFLWLLLIRKTPFKFIFLSGVGLVLALGIGLLVDYWLYDDWVLSWWNYLDLNLFQDKASNFGREPIHFFITQALLQLIPPFSLLIICFTAGFWLRFRSHAITWITLPFIVLHFFVAHKELRFLFPMLNFIPFMMLYYYQSVEHSPRKWAAFLRTKHFVRFAVTVNVLLLLYFCLKHADNSAPVLKKIYTLTDEKSAVLLYDGVDPYNEGASLHYFRNPLIKTVSTKDSTYQVTNPDTYYYAETFDRYPVIVKNNKVFTKQYSNFPAWFKYLDFNGWLDRSDPFSIYKIYTPQP